ncbi:hypothetical protein MESS4_240043 [Mesorhizobium sp. STM 4661]|nr:hypothetical protein MESS4_240043 [Mesorhizobium sp. STM 4661]
MSIIASNARVSVSVRGLQVTTLEVWGIFHSGKESPRPSRGTRHRAASPFKTRCTTQRRRLYCPLN